MSEKTKTLPPGYPVVGDNGAITGLTIDEIARRVGEQLGVQHASYGLPGDVWCRIARVNSEAGKIYISNSYIGPMDQGFAIEFAAVRGVTACTAKIMGNTSLIEYVRFVGKDSEIYLEVYCPARAATTPTSITLISSANSKTTELYSSYIKGNADTGFSIKKFTLAELRGG